MTPASRDAGWAVVVPTVGRPSLFRLLASLGVQDGPTPSRIVVVDDRPVADAELDVRIGRLKPTVLRTGGRGPAAARNAGWRAVAAEWVVFLDDDVVVTPLWSADLTSDLGWCEPDVAACQGRIDVPLPRDRWPTDAERNTANLADAAWVTADMAVRRGALEQIGGFDERFRRAYREDSDLALRLLGAGWRLARGTRTTVHPVRPSGEWDSVRAQAGNADDALMRRIHGAGWRHAASAPPGRLPWHLATTGVGTAAVAAGLGGARRLAAVTGLTWAVLTAWFAAGRISAGPRTPGEVRRMVLTSVAIPPTAVGYRMLGAWRHRAVGRTERRP
jgi:glycosyltransferase involved in cell wall biosynthesis